MSAQCHWNELVSYIAGGNMNWKNLLGKQFSNKCQNPQECFLPFSLPIYFQELFLGKGNKALGKINKQIYLK